MSVVSCVPKKKEKQIEKQKWLVFLAKQVGVLRIMWQTNYSKADEINVATQNQVANENK